MNFLISTFGSYFDERTFWEQPLGGIQSTSYLLFQGLRELGHEVWLVHDSGRASSIALTFDKLDCEYIGWADGIIHVQFFDSRFSPYLNSSGRQVLWTHLNGTEYDWSSILSSCFRVVCLSKFQLDGYIECFGVKTKYGRVLPYPYVSSLFKEKRASFGNKQLIYCSHPQKGLKPLLEMLPMLSGVLRSNGVKLKLVTGGEIYFPENKGIGELEDLIGGYEDVVEFIGAVSMPMLVDELAGSSILSYPCFTDESFCLIALFAQAVGLPVITTDYGALSETAKGQVLIEPEMIRWWGPGPITPYYKKQFVDSVDLLLSNENIWNHYSKRGLNNPLINSCDYKKAAQGFVDLFKEEG